MAPTTIETTGCAARVQIFANLKACCIATSGDLDIVTARLNGRFTA